MLAQHLDMRKSDLRRRYINLLLAEGFITGDAVIGYDTVPDIENRLEKFLEESGSNRAEHVRGLYLDEGG
jgi:hypothetical protein